jgi:hypothetical protein
MHRTIKVAAVAVTSLIAIGVGSAAHASVSATFIGKGDVQTAFNLTNPAIQKLIDANEQAFKFTSKQAVTQAVSQVLSQTASQSATQDGSQDGTQLGTETTTQEVTETTVCTKTNGQVDQRSRHGDRTVIRTATRTATREGERTGSRSSTQIGSRDGSRSGTIFGNIDASIDAKARKTGQWTGWNVKSVTQAPVQMGAPAFGADEFPGYTWGGYNWGNYDFGAWNLGSYDFGDPVVFSTDPASLSDVEWSAWDTDGDSNADPDTCFQNSNNLVPGSFHDTFEFGTPTASVEDKPVEEGEIHDGLVEEAPISENGVVGYNSPINVDSTTYGPVVVWASLNGGPSKALNAV